jgi:nicotinate-nucleotide--dimethylbenzimidazole phosphoribosyltransferase
LHALLVPRQPTDSAFALDIDRRLASKTMPAGALGRLQECAAQLALIEGPSCLRPEGLAGSDAQIIVFAADHGLSAEGVSAYPREVTWQMVLNILHGGAAISVLSRHSGAPLWVANMGVEHRFDPHPQLIDQPVAWGSANCLYGDALTLEQVEQALLTGARILEQCQASQASRWVVFGEMGIGNTSIASLMLAGLLGLSIDPLVGRGTGLEDRQLLRKHVILRAVVARHPQLFAAPSMALGHASGAGRALAVAKSVGGLEILGIAGAMLRSAQLNKAVIVDGFIATAAAVMAIAMQPEVRASMIFSHCSAESGHRQVLQAIKAHPLLDLGLRLGEGSGAALVIPLLSAARKILLEMASFESAAVAQRSAT